MKTVIQLQEKIVKVRAKERIRFYEHNTKAVFHTFGRFTFMFVPEEKPGAFKFVYTVCSRNDRFRKWRGKEECITRFEDSGGYPIWGSFDKLDMADLDAWAAEFSDVIIENE